MKKLGKYEITGELGKGAMGVVYEGFDPFIKRKVAIKTVMKSMLDNADAQDLLNRFRVEAEAAGRMTHPNIVAIYEYNEDENIAFIAMEFIKGKELKAYFDSGERFQIKDAVKIMSQLLEALDYSHKHGVVHRDIKPANIIITESGQAKVADFGIARIESSHLTQLGTVLGTPTHMSPEQFMGQVVDNRTDIYSAGVILYQFVTGENPFTGSVVNIMHKVLHQEPAPPSVLNFSVPKALDNVVKKAMSKSPEDRFQTAEEFLTALRSATEPLSTNSEDTLNREFSAGSADATIIAPDMLGGGINASKTEIDLWKHIKNSQNLQDFLRYIEEYPFGEFIELANLRIATLEPIAKLKAQEELQQETEQSRLEKEWAEAEARNQSEQSRLEREWAEAQAKLKAERLRLEKERTEAETRRKAEMARLEKERAEAEARRKAEQQRLEQERAEAEAESRRKAELARIERERAEAEAQRKAEQAKLEQEKAEALANLRAEQARLEKEKAEAQAELKAEHERIEKERAEADAQRKAELARLERERGEAEAQRKAEHAKLEQEKAEALANLRAEQARLAKERAEAQAELKAEQERIEKERAEAEAHRRVEHARLEKEKTEALAKLKLEQERLEQENAQAQAKLRTEQERLKQERAEARASLTAEQARLEKENAEAQARIRAEQEQLEKERAEAQARLKSEQEQFKKERAMTDAQRKSELAGLEKERAETEARRKSEKFQLDKEMAESAALRKKEQAQHEQEKAKAQAKLKAQQEQFEKEREASQVKLKKEHAQLAKERTEALADLSAEQARLDKQKAEHANLNFATLNVDPDQTVFAKAPTPITAPKKKPVLPILAGIAAVAIGAGVWIFFGSSNESAPQSKPAGEMVTGSNTPEIGSMSDQAKHSIRVETTQGTSQKASVVSRQESKQKAELSQLKNQLAEARAQAEAETRRNKEELARIEQERKDAEKQGKAAADARAAVEAETRRRKEELDRLDQEKKLAEAEALRRKEELARLESANAAKANMSDSQVRLEREKAEAKRKADEAAMAAAAYQQALSLEDSGDMVNAMKSYLVAANAGHGLAMKRLGDIYGTGNNVVPRDYAAQIKWYSKAKKAGIDINSGVTRAN